MSRISCDRSITFKSVASEIERTCAACNSRSKIIASTRSEEHTSELQSHHDIVCRLLLEKQKTNPINGRRALAIVKRPYGVDYVELEIIAEEDLEDVDLVWKDDLYLKLMLCVIIRAL